MRGKKTTDDRQADLFEWAASRPSAEIFYATRLFQQRTNQFIRLLLCGYVPPRHDANVIDIAGRKPRPKRRKTKAAPRMRDAS